MYEAMNDKTGAEERFLSLLMEADGEGQSYRGEPIIADYSNPEIGEYFGAYKNQLVFEAMRSLHAQGKPIDIINVVEELKKAQNYDKAGGFLHVSYLAGLEIHRRSRSEQLAAVENRFEYLKKSYLKRRSAALCMNIGNMAKGDNNAEQVLGYVKSELEQITDLKDKLTIKEKQYDMFDSWLDQTEAIMVRSNEAFVPTGYEVLDRDYFHGGLERGNLIICAGRTSMGKTTFCTNVSANVAKSGGSVLYFSMEMTQKQIVDRIVSRETNIPVKFCYNPSLTCVQDQNRIFEAGQDICHWKLYVNDTAGLTVAQIADFARQYRRHVGSLDLIVVDHLLLLNDSTHRKSDTKADLISQNTLELKNIAKNMRVPVIAISQLNRQVEMRQNKKPVLSDLRGSGATEENADVVILMFREDYYAKDTKDKDVLEVDVAKNRSGGTTGTVLFKFDKPCQKLTEDPISVFGTPANNHYATGIAELDIPNGLDDYNVLEI